jgi:hypothetical protein
VEQEVANLTAIGVERFRRDGHAGHVPEVGDDRDLDESREATAFRAGWNGSMAG